MADQHLATSTSLKQPWLLPLLLCSEQASTHEGPYPLDRIRMQKAVFLTSERGPVEWRSAYTYAPYNWGPYSRDLSDDLNRCISGKLVRLSHVNAPRYGRYALTDAGQDIADQLWSHLSSAAQNFLVELRSWVTHKDFNTLLKDVYDEFPDYATNSMWTGKR